MNKKNIKDFFDKCASWWDEDMVRNEDIISTILNNADIKEDVSVLDVASGTGVLFDDYLNRKVNKLVGIDLSGEMVKIAKQKYPEIEVICADVETYEFNTTFDRIVVYNAFPHFPDPKHLIEKLHLLLNENGILSIAHGMSRKALLKHHEGRASSVSIELLEIEDLIKLMEPYFDIIVSISNDKMYQIVGKKKQS